MTQFGHLLALLSKSGVEFILIGGVAAWAHGSSRATVDLEVVYERSEANLKRIADALASIHPYLRGAPPGLPFRLDLQTLKGGLNFTLTTDLGSLDLLGEIAGGGGYENLLPHSSVMTMLDASCRCLNLDKLIEVKRAAGRPKDFEAVAELEGMRNERKTS